MIEPCATVRKAHDLIDKLDSTDLSVDCVLINCGTNDLESDLSAREIAQEINRL